MVEKQKAVVENGVQKIRITAEKGYSPKEFQLQKGIPAEITFHRVNPSGCYKEILFEDQGILEPLEVGVDKVISFTPTETGDFEFSCGMKMQKGSYTVVEKRRRVLSLRDRFWITSIFTLPLLILMIGMMAGFVSHPVSRWGTFLATTPIMLVAGVPFIKSAWASFKKHHSNMDTLVALGTLVAYVYSVFALFTGQPVYFEAAGFIIFFILLGQIFEERMRNNASEAVEKLLDLQAKTVISLSVDGQVIGLIAIQDAPKASSKEAIKKLKERGLKTVMLTGDNERVAQAIAKQVGIDTVIADVLPQEKASAIQKLQEASKVAFVGDGINDAPALSIADVGIAMGSGTDIAIESGGIVLMQNDLLGVVRAFDMSQKTFRRILLNLFWASIYNILGLPIAAGVFVGLGLTLNPELAGLAMALSSLSVLTSSLLLNVEKID